MVDIENILNKPNYSIDADKKKHLFNIGIKKLTKYHSAKCLIYKKIIKLHKYENVNNYEGLPFLPVKIFKDLDLKSVPKKKIIKVIKSSGTTNQNLSKIYLDKKNSLNQIKVLKKITEPILGNKRLPMIIVDKKPNNFDRKEFNAKLVAIYGFSIFGKSQIYILDKNGNVNYKELNNFLKIFKNEKKFIFGFTSNIYETFVKNISTSKIKYDIKNSILIHGGGWKKLEEKKIDNISFKKKIKNKFGIKSIINYYGLVEQTGSIFFECEKCNHFITSNFSDVIIRDKDFNLKSKGQGLIQLISLIPSSYPGHNILTEDIGEVVNNKGCYCGKMGKGFIVHGRTKQAEPRGCSDT